VQSMHNPLPTRVGIIGLGQVGLPTAKYIIDKGLEVWGYKPNRY
jgi:UDP-N-acetyl-D-mannosaminuronate dehydrogenase